jgi:signal transduction histidine kinase
LGDRSRSHQVEQVVPAARPLESGKVAFGTVSAALVECLDAANARVEALERQLEAADRLATLGTLAAGLAHEINNPLASVLANLELALRDLELVPDLALLREARRSVVEAHAAAEGVRLIVKDLRLLSHFGNDVTVPVDVEAALDSALRLAKNELQQRATVVKHYGAVPPIAGVPSRLGQVFLNLVVNAAQAIPEGDAEGNRIVVTTSVDEHGNVVISIADTGRGIPEQIKQQIFSTFFTTKPSGEGTGLGLSLSQRIVRSFGGEISFSSQLGLGTEFRVTLPVAPTPAA